MLKAHVLSKRAEGVVSGPLFPHGEGNYCAKQAVVDSIRKAVDLTGGNSFDGNGRWAMSGHTFRITGARMLSSMGLDLISIQLLGRWGSSAMLSYLAETPLTSMADRMCSKALRHWVSAEASPPSGDLDNRAGFGRIESDKSTHGQAHH